MHELALCQELIAEVTRIAAAHDAVGASRILVMLGPLSGVEAPLLKRAFLVARVGTVAEEATLEIEQQPLSVRCTVCGAKSEVTPTNLLCRTCGAWQVEILEGDALLLKSVELFLDTAAEDHPVEQKAAAETTSAQLGNG
ncbi:MAG: hydrogenase maturation nickel metallochaperone HypA [Acidobacteriia bacterium]|nr:hydrogenase maturation nickel metallochaperone HypA [Methyloceanibacter sp.]MCL6492900.1 hydrogenase maturation nickel metallochaperone HypA [Terriglobia bacterium]